MIRLGIALEAAFEADTLAHALARPLEATLGGPEAIVGGLVLATAAAGALGEAVGHRLASRWPAAELVGTSFEGIVLDGRVWEGEPAVAVLAWTDGGDAPGVIACESSAPADELAGEIRAVVARSGTAPRGLLLLFPDALGTPGLGALLDALVETGVELWLAGAAATGPDGGAALSWFLPAEPGRPPEPGELLVGVWFPSGPAPPAAHPLVRAVGATRLASPWLEITACRPHWIDALEGEPPSDWIRRQLGLDETEPLEPYLDRLLVRIARGCDVDPSRSVSAPGFRGGGREGGDRSAEPLRYEERFLSGIDRQRGSISVSGRFARFDRLAFALPDAADAREALRAAVDALPRTSLLLQLGCPGRGTALHGDPDLESAIVAHQAGRPTLGVIAPFQLATEEALPELPGANAPTVRRFQLRVHTTVLAAAGPEAASAGGGIDSKS